MATGVKSTLHQYTRGQNLIRTFECDFKCDQFFHFGHFCNYVEDFKPVPITIVYNYPVKTS